MEPPRTCQGFENVGWTVGNYCNAMCGHCYSWEVRKDSRAFLTKLDVDRVVEQLKRLGIKTVNLGGNEPIYTGGPDIKSTLLPYIIRALTDAKVPVGITTNGTSFVYLERHHREELMMLNDIDFSLDSPFEEEHDLNRRAKLFRLTLGAVQRSLEMGMDCSIITCGMRRNFDREHLSAFLALTKLLGSEFRVNALRPVDSALLPEMPTPEEFYEGFSFLLKNTRCVTLGESCLTSFTQAGSEGCPCGTSSFRINGKSEDGTISINPCVYSHQYRTGDLLRHDIFDIVASPAFSAFASRRKEIPKPCRESGCRFLERCRGGCASRSLFVYGGLDYKDPYCPQDYFDKYGRPDVPELKSIGCENGIRVHDNYLCTWIGSVNPDFHDDRYNTIEQYFEGQRRNPAEPICGRKLVQRRVSSVEMSRPVTNAVHIGNTTDEF
jgi:radical SAM protein with 4Fe4S-binding SPASM domain